MVLVTGGRLLLVDSLRALVHVDALLSSILQFVAAEAGKASEAPVQDD